MFLFLLSFVAGVLTILAPCTLPLLPLMVGSSIAGGGESATTNKKKAVTIAASLGISIILFTFILKVSTAFIAIPPETWSIISGTIIIIFGLVTVFPTIWEKIPYVSKLSIGSNKILGSGYQKKSFWGDVIIGASLGPVFSTCSPTYFVILATVLPQSLLAGLVDLIAYAVGLSGMVLLIAFLGQKIVNKLGVLSDPNGIFKKILGLIFLVLGVGIIFGIDKVVETKLLNSGIFDITKVEQKLLELNKKTTNSNQAPSSDTAQNILNGLPVQTCNATSCLPVANGNVPSNITATNTASTSGNNSTVQKNTNAPVQPNVVQKDTTPLVRLHGPAAPEITNPSDFINTNGQPITISQFRGKKIVLIDFWTYSCINCQRSLPYVNAWYDKYKDQGLEVIGIHTPEFAFEKVKSNVEEAVKKLGIKYPVVMDSNYGTWGAFDNNSWPRKYLIDENGEIIYDHVGEGEYDKTEEVIQQALKNLNESKGVQTNVSSGIVAPDKAIDPNSIKVGSPEVYFGYGRNQFLVNGSRGTAGNQDLIAPDTSLNSKDVILKNSLYLGGSWNFQEEHADSQGPATVVFDYSAKNVYMVASSDKPITLHIYIDGVKKNDVVVSGNTLYTLYEGSGSSEHLLRIETDGAGLKAFTFTFG